MEALLDRFRVETGREPTAEERTRLADRATLTTRRGKTHGGETRDGQIARWAAEHAAELGVELGEIARAVLGNGADSGHDPGERFTERDLVHRALALVAQRGQSWTRSNLLRAVSYVAPANLALAPGEISQFLERLADKAEAQACLLNPHTGPEGLAAEYYRADGTSVFLKPGAARFATSDQLLGEAELRAAAVRRGAPAWQREDAEAVLARFAHSGRELSADQAAALVGILTSGAAVEVLAAPAGTGKSFLVGILAETWPDTGQPSPTPGAGTPGTGENGRRVFGVAYGQRQADLLTEQGVMARNITGWLTGQARLDAGSGSLADEAFRVRRGDLLVVDEAGAAPTADLVAIHRRCAAAGVKLLLVGDPRQIGAVGPSGALADIAERGIRYELAEVRRFTHAWEGPASLRLRDGDDTVIHDYAKHGRLVDAGTLEQAETAASRAWLAATLAGQEAMLIVGSNQTAARVSHGLRAELVRLGRVQEPGARLGMPGWEGSVAGVGDLVQARRNGWHLAGYAGNTEVPINRATYRITALAPDGRGLTVARVLGRGDDGAERLGAPMRLPGAYVARYLTLGYASTVHAAHGRTVDAGFSVLAPGTDTASAYVRLTRGRQVNTAFVVTRAVSELADVGETHKVHPREAAAVLADVIRPPNTDRTRTALTEAETAADRAAATPTHLEPLLEIINAHLSGRTSRWLDHLAASAELLAPHRTALAAENARGTLEPLLRRAELAGHNAEHLLHEAVTSGTLDGSASLAQVLHFRIRTALGDAQPPLSSYHDLLPYDLPADISPGLQALADAADSRRAHLASALADQPPQWIIEALGPAPADDTGRSEWEHAAGWTASYRELARHTDTADPLGAAPPAGLAEKHAIFRTAHDALDLPDVGPDEEAMTEGRLRVRVAAYAREQNSAPRYVADELAAAHEQLRRRDQDAEVWAARAETHSDPLQAEQLRTAAADARAEADRLRVQVEQLERADDARAAWWIETAVTRDNAERARIALALRGINLDDPDDRVTPAEWLQLEHAAREADDPHRDIHEHDLTGERSADPTAVAEENSDLRDLAESDPQERIRLSRRIPPGEDIAATIERAHKALEEINRRSLAERAASGHAGELEPHEDTRRAELIRWAELDVREQERAAEHDDGLAFG